MNKVVEKDYTSKYDQYKINVIDNKNQEIAIEKPLPEIESSNSKTDYESELLKELKTYRLMKSREEKIKPYFIYNDKQLSDLIEKMPKSIIELQGVSGFGEIKANKYGGAIIKILDKFR